MVGTQSKSIAGDPCCSGDPEGKARGSMRGLRQREGPTEGTICIII